MSPIAKKLTLAATTLVILVLLLEVIVRLFDLHIPPERTSYLGFEAAIHKTEHPFYPGYDGPILGSYLYRYKPESTWMTQYPSNERGYFNDKNQIVYRLNTDGFRDADFRPKRAKAYRVIAIGDSCTFGEGVRVEDTYPKVLEQILRVHDDQTEVYNLGVNGYGIRDEATLLDGHLAQFQPDLVIWGFVLNDISHAAFDEWYMDYAQRKRDSSIESPSYLLDFIQQSYWSATRSRQFVEFVLGTYENPSYWQQLTDLLRTSVAAIRSAKAKILVVMIPHLSGMVGGEYNFEPVNVKMRAFFDEEHIPYLDLTDRFLAYGPTELRVHARDGHPNQIAHAIAAQAIQDYLAAHAKDFSLGGATKPR